jgi:hypothetical protein
MAIITDGTGNSYAGKIDKNNHFHTRGTDETLEFAEVSAGNAYNLNTGDITFTGTSAVGVSYLKNNEDQDLIITNFIYLIGTSTGGSGDQLVQVISGPTAGTLISGSGSDGTPVNRNFGSANTLAVNWQIGTGSTTVTDGTTAIETRLPSSGRVSVPVPVVLPKGAACAIKYTPPAGNTSQKCQFAFAVYLSTLRED